MLEVSRERAPLACVVSLISVEIAESSRCEPEVDAQRGSHSRPGELDPRACFLSNRAHRHKSEVKCPHMVCSANVGLAVGDARHEMKSMRWNERLNSRRHQPPWIMYTHLV